jgi:hypothetical protein
MSIKQSFLNAKRAVKTIEIPEIGETVHISKWSAMQRAHILPEVAAIEEFETKKEKCKEMIISMSKIVQFSLNNSEGIRVFDDTEEDLKAILNFDGEVIERIAHEILDFNGMTDKDAEIKEAAKN